MLTPMIFVKDLDAMARFYREAFQLVDDDDASSPGFVVMARDGTRLALHALPDHVASRIMIAGPPEPRGEVAIKLLFTVDDVPTARADLERLGAQLFDGETDDACDVIDPEGNVLRISNS